MPRAHARRPASIMVVPILVAALAVGVTAGCGTSAAVPAADAVGRYDAAVADLEEALAGTGVTWEHLPATRTVEERDEGCAYDPGTWEPSSSAEEDLRSPDGWRPWLDAAAPVLAEHGFEAVDEPERVEGTLRLRSEDHHGAELTIDMSGRIRIWGARIDATPCAPASLGL